MTLHEEGYTEREIGVKLNISPSTVHDIINFIRINGSSTPKSKNSGRKHIRDQIKT